MKLRLSSCRIRLCIHANDEAYQSPVSFDSCGQTPAESSNFPGQVHSTCKALEY